MTKLSPEFSIDPFTGDIIIISPNREKRPFQENVSCPFCIDSPELKEYQDSEDIVFLDNKYPSMIYKDNKGICQVYIYSFDHFDKIFNMKKERISTLLLAIQNHQEELMKKYPGLKYLLFFENSGREIGISMDHPHGQVYGFPYIPPKINQELNQFKKQCFLCKYSTNNLLVQIFTTNSFAILFSKSSRWPFELILISKDHKSSLSDLTNEEINDMATCFWIMLQIFYRYHNENTPYIYAIHQTPFNQKDEFHLHIELFTLKLKNGKQKYLAGVELSVGTFINSVNSDNTLSNILRLIKDFQT